MELSQLTAYAREKYHMEEQHKWADFPGFSVLVCADTGKWVALLMRQWDHETGTEIQRCDIKCGRAALSGLSAAWLSAPFRMKGVKWVGVIVDDRTDPETVFRLFDQAVREEQRTLGGGFTVVLDQAENKAARGQVFLDTLLPFVQKGAGALRRGTDSRSRRKPGSQDRDSRGSQNRGSRRFWPGETAESGSSFTSFRNDMDIPDRILDMISLYEYGDGSYAEKYRNFYRQGKFMEDYEDDAPWNGEYRHFFPVYHDLNIRQLRGYFTWRTAVRKGIFQPVSVSLTYIYLYELLCGIGSAGASDTLRKMEAFRAGFADAGYGDHTLQRNLRRWMFEYAIVKQVPAAETLQYLGPDVRRRDEALAVLRFPADQADETLFGALALFAGDKLENSAAVRKDEARGKHLFALLWREMAAKYEKNGGDLFTSCFGERSRHSWYPLANAVFWEENGPDDTDYVLSEARSYHCRDGRWYEERYDSLHFDMDCLRQIVHESDRLFRRYLKAGNYLRAKAEEAWVTPYAEAAIEADRREQIEAARPKIEIDLSGLEKIRKDSLATRDSLLLPEEMPEEEISGSFFGAETKEDELIPGAVRAVVTKEDAPASRAAFAVQAKGGKTDPHAVYAAQGQEETSAPDAVFPGCGVPEAACESREGRQGTVPESTAQERFPGLDECHERILLAVLHGEEPGEMIRDGARMPSVVTDTINEALFDEIGDSILECDGSRISLVEDYREDVMRLFGEEE